MTSEPVANPYPDGVPPRSPLAEHLGIDPLEVDEQHAVARILLEDHHKQPRGAVHAGVLLSLADNTATILANRVNGVGGALPGFMVSIDLHAVLLSNVSEGEIRATARLVRRGRRVTVIRTEVTGEDGRTLTEVTTTHIPT
ncbi:MAG: PaaI family thioesterase [Dehalococcoidia bacterium]|nr:PaaI family thioesterase [Dehalococcoidia bacterium]